MTLAILTEKPSAGRAFAAALGGMSGTYNGEQYTIVSARGHLYELAQPEDQLRNGTEADVVRMRSWDLKHLPWDEKDFTWKRVPIRGANDTIKQLRQALRAASEIVIATDIDPTGEGDAIAWNIIDELNLHSKRFSRMEFTDEAAPSLQKAFTKRRAITSMMDEGAYRKADFRNKLDFLTMQHTRVASKVCGQRAVLRQGRLKSAMVNIVGAQLEAHNNYVKTVMFQNRFRDENEVMYTNPEEPKFNTAGEVPQIYGPSPVVLDKREDKRTAPRRLLDLAALSARLSSKNAKASAVLAVYQEMYEAQIVSYPRTEDKTITTEQFNEMLPLVDKIAQVVSVDPGILTHRTPRKTHVKDSGAHGANRPGVKVPGSLEQLKKDFGPLAPLIYEELARSFLAMFAEDYLYEAQEGHLEKYPAFIGRVNIPKSAGWKAVFNEDKEETEGGDDREAENSRGLGTTAMPFVYEVVPPRPPHPTMKWLMKQPEKRDVGTGATRTSTYAEVTMAKSEKNKYPLLVDTRGKITMTEFGDMSYKLLPGTYIGDLTLTEQVYTVMRDIADGKTSSEKELAVVASWVRADIETMQRTAATMRKDLGLTDQVIAERASGIWAETGEEVSFKRQWSGHEFTDQEIADLLAGKEISFEMTSRAGNPYTAKGKLGQQEFNGKSYIGFGLSPRDTPKDANGNDVVPEIWCKHVFTSEERAKLAAGEKVFADDFVSSKSGRTFGATVRFGSEKGSPNKKIIPEFG